MTVSIAARRRRRTETGLIVMALVLIAGAYVLASFGRNASLPTGIIPWLAAVMALFVGAHLLVRRFATNADPIILPVVAYVVTYRLCLGLQHSDRAVLEHGIETGVLKRLPNGQFIEVHQPLGPVDSHGHPVPLAYQGAPVPKRMNQLGSAGVAVPGLLAPADDSGHIAYDDELHPVSEIEAATKR